jgi:hypothetical protein
LIFIGIGNAQGQNTELPIQNSKYERATLKLIVVKSPKNDINNKTVPYIDKLKIDRKFDIFETQNPSLTYVRDKKYKKIPSQLRDTLLKYKFGNEYLKQWFGWKNGEYSMDLIKEKGMLNAKDFEKQVYSKSKRGKTALEDLGEKLISKSYVLIFDYNSVYDQEENYSLNFDFVNIYVFKLDFGEEQLAKFYEKGWRDSTYLDTLKTNFKYITQTYLRVPRSLPADKYFAYTLNEALSELAVDYPDFRAKATLQTEKPPLLKLGYIDKIDLDSRFFVYKRVFKPQKGIVYRRVGVARVGSRVYDSTSIIFMESGVKPRLGLLFEERKDYGFAFSAGYGVRALYGAMVKLDYNFGKILGVSRLKFSAELHFGGQNIYLGNGNLPIDINSTNAHLSIAKEYNIVNQIHIEPFVGFNAESVSAILNDEEIQKLELGETKLSYKYRISTFYAGIRLPINITGNLQLLPQVSYIPERYPFNSIFSKDLPSDLSTEFKTDVAGIDDTKKDWQLNNSRMFINRYPWKWDISLRFKF